MKAEHSEILRNRAFEFQDIQVWMARHDHQLQDIHSAYHSLNGMDYMLHPTEYIIDNWYGGSIEAYFKETNSSFKEYIKRIKACYDLSLYN